MISKHGQEPRAQFVQGLLIYKVVGMQDLPALWKRCAIWTMGILRAPL